MSLIEVHVLGAPLVQNKGEIIHFQFQKAEALFYYLCIEKTATRSSLSKLFWPSLEETIAKKNLRNTIYSIKNTLPPDIILSNDKNTVSLNTDYDISIDIDLFKKEAAESYLLYNDGLMPGYYLKDSREFEAWLANASNNVLEIYLTKLYQKIISLQPNQLAELEMFAELYLKENTYDEKVYCYLMKIYYDNGLYYKGIQIYQKLSDILDKELAIAPDRKTTALYHDLLNAWSDTSATLELNTEIIPGREDIINSLINAYSEFLAGKPNRFIIIGEQGTGKSFLAEQFINQINLSGTLYLRPRCPYERTSFSESPWIATLSTLLKYMDEHTHHVYPSYLQTLRSAVTDRQVFFHADKNVKSYLEDYRYVAFRNHFIKTLSQLGHDIPIVIFIDNIHLMDSISLDLLSNIIRMKQSNLFILTTCLDAVSYDMVTFISSLTKENLLNQINLERFSKEAVISFVYNLLKLRNLERETIEQIYDENEGNTFFIIEFLNNYRYYNESSDISADNPGILNDSLLRLSSDARQLLDVISVFQDSVTLEMLLNIMNMKADSILYLLEDLKDYGLIVEEQRGAEVFFRFKYNNMRLFVYDMIPKQIKATLHNHAGAAYENIAVTKGIPAYYTQLIHHYTFADNMNKIKYYSLNQT